MAIAKGTYPLGNTYLNIPEFVALSCCKSKFNACHGAKKRKAYHDAFIAFLDYMIGYANLNIGGISYQDAGAIIFGGTKRITKNVCRSQLLAAKCYAEEIKDTVSDESLMANVDTLVTNLLSEFEDILVQSERILHRNAVDSKVFYPDTTTFTLQDIMSAADQLMFAYATKTMSNFDYRNTQPYVMVQVRQIIENAAFYSLGIEKITTLAGTTANGVITETLNFLIRSKDAVNYTIKLPLKPTLILQLYKWACTFVHKGTLSAGCKIYFALFLTRKLLEQPLAPIRIYDNTFKHSHEYGDIRIEHYQQMKSDYEGTINPRGRRIIHWMPVEDIGAYIISI